VDRNLVEEVRALDREIARLLLKRLKLVKNLDEDSLRLVNARRTAF
jgi:hypothetical protein